MNRVNLLPADRQAVRRHRRARRRWLAINLVYAALLALVGAGYVASRPATPDAIAGPTPNLAGLNATLVSLRQQSAQLQLAARSSASAAERPDFSRLLAAIARARGESVTLEAVDLVAAKDTASPRTLVLTGVGRSHAEVTQFAMRVEAMGVFAAVRLADVVTRPMGPSGGVGESIGEGVGFRLNCPLVAEDR